jgi:glutathione synthase/RimK-type ligase-like ATP-grasp enzyme
VVVKPRFGSWGKDVFCCETQEQLESCLDQIRERSWFNRHGALIQPLVAYDGYDVRVLVARNAVVGAIERFPAEDEWRTNSSLGGLRRECVPSSSATALALAAATTVGADLVGVDLLPIDGRHLVLELNGAVEFDSLYSLPGCDACGEIARALTISADARYVEH